MWADQVEATKIGKKSEKYEKSIDTRCYAGEKSKRMQQRRKNLEHRQQHAIDDKSKLLKNIESNEELKLIPISYHKDKLVTLNDISINYRDKTVCERVDISISRGDRISLQGRNGCGKSSIIKLIMGEAIEYKGDMQRGSNLLISYISQSTSLLNGDLSSYAKQYDIDESLFKSILRKLDFSRIQFDKNMEFYSDGQKKKVLIARSLCEKAHLYIWDEPLNYIDILSRIQIEELLLTYQPTLLFVEHDKMFCEKIATRNIYL